MVYVYVLQNDWSKKIYIGQTIDLETRLKRHNGLLPNKLKSYTSINKSKGTWKVIYQEHYKTRTEAVKREKFLKSHMGRDWLRLKIGSLAQR